MPSLHWLERFGTVRLASAESHSHSVKVPIIFTLVRFLRWNGGYCCPLSPFGSVGRVFLQSIKTMPRPLWNDAMDRHRSGGCLRNPWAQWNHIRVDTQQLMSRHKNMLVDERTVELVWDAGISFWWLERREANGSRCGFDCSVERMMAVN